MFLYTAICWFCYVILNTLWYLFAKLHEAHLKRSVTMNTLLIIKRGSLVHKTEMLNTLQLLS